MVFVGAGIFLKFTLNLFGMKYCLVFLFLACICNINAQVQLKVLTYNIFHGENPYKKGMPNLDDIAGLINELKPDMVALQEVDSATGRLEKIYGKRINWVQELAAKTGMQGYFGKAMDYDGGGYGEGLLIKQRASFWVQALPNPSGGEPRAVIYAVVNVDENKQVLFAGTHLCHQFLPNKIAQVKALGEIMRNNKLPAVLAGDFNFAPEAEPYSNLLEDWKDAAVARGNPQYSFPANKPATRIDYIWLDQNTQWNVKKLEVLSAEFSDHRPVFAILELKK